MRDTTRALGTLVVAVIFLIVASGFFMSGQSTKQYIEGVIVTIVSLGFFMIAWYYFQRGRKEKR